jgi:hypothetical protein
MIEVKPKFIYRDRKHYCPVCDYELKFNTKYHKLCGVKFNWEGLKPIYKVKPMKEILNYYPLKAKAISEKTHYSKQYIENQLLGICGLNDAVRETLIEELPIYIRNLKFLLRELKEDKNE